MIPYFFPNRPILYPPNHNKIKELSLDKNWIAEIKKNGDRLCLIKHDNNFFFYNRHKQILKYSPSSQLLQELYSLNIPNDTQLDGELLHNKTKHIKNTIFFYDIISWNNKQCNISFKERRQTLINLINPQLKCIHLIKQYSNNFIELFNKVIKQNENEGLVLKNLNGKIQFNFNKSPDVVWQIKIRRPHKNYKF